MGKFNFDYVREICHITSGILLAFFIVGVGLGVPYTLTLANSYHELCAVITTADPVSAANLYMVFSALLLAGLAIAMTFWGIFISAAITKERKDILDEHIVGLMQTIGTEDKHVDSLIKKLSEHSKLKNYLGNLIAERTQELQRNVKANIMCEIKTQLDLTSTRLTALEAKTHPEALEIKKDITS